MLMCSGAFAARVNFSYASDYCDFFLTIAISNLEGFKKLRYAKKLEWPSVLLLDKAVL